jgi:hypothetical protein
VSSMFGPLALPLPSDLTHYETLICMWLGSDLPLLEQMRLLADGDEYEYDDLGLASTVVDMLYDPEYGKTVFDLVHVMRNCGDAAKAAPVRSSVPLTALLDIDMDGWARIRTALLAGAEKGVSL